jgi:serine/threonine-protein phosphatase CPPED1
MIVRITLCALALAGALPSQSFIQMSDPQFGMYLKDAGFEHETVNFEFAIATANRLKPAFVVITGDLVNNRESAVEVAEFRRVAAKLDPGIRLFNVAGNHDVGNEPSPESLAAYRERFGPDYYTFRIGDVAGFVVNSSLLKAPAKVHGDAAKMEAWLSTELAKAKRDGVKHLIVFQHIPPFMKDPNEPETYDSFPLETRARYLKLLHEYGVNHLFAGHYHATAEARDGDLEIHVTGPVGMPLRGGKSGMRIVTVKPGTLTHQYYDFGVLPESLAPPPATTTK